MKHIRTTQTGVDKLRAEAKARHARSGNTQTAERDAVAGEAGYHHWKHVLDCLEESKRQSAQADLAHVRWPGVPSPALHPSRMFDSDHQFWRWYERNRLAAVLMQTDAVQKAQKFCALRCTAYVDDFIGHDQRPPLSESIGADAWLQEHIGGLYPVDASGQPVTTGDYIAVNTTIAYRLADGTTIAVGESYPARGSLCGSARRREGGHCTLRQLLFAIGRGDVDATFSRAKSSCPPSAAGWRPGARSSMLRCITTRARLRTSLRYRTTR